MVPVETWVAYTAACILIILVPGPDNILAVSRGLSQGRLAASISSVGAGLGLMVHVLVALLGLAALIQTSAAAFSVVKFVGAGYLIWLGIKALRSRSLITFQSNNHLPYRAVFVTGFLTNVLNPKPALFILAFVPQFVSPMHGSIELQTLILGTWFAFMAFSTFAVLGVFSSIFARWLESHPRAILGLNIGAGSTFIAAGLSVVFLENTEKS
ncbi:LysE family translocator [Natronospirillum operosum]|uniref:LysE family translocator n=1 Tax=Natronospirillum operosum TaxID=2759953 RepID=A0A4Z0W2V2_9GAMM|nr:LysE family translocator [Natronospirillum operosum]TGG89383.1 LysE family translocator [Natronospirillum operosum]